VKTARPTFAFGPVVPGWGSWEWVGAETATFLRRFAPVKLFGPGDEPTGDVIVFIKHPPPDSLWAEIERSRRIVYAPIDHYGSPREIDADWRWLRRCDLILVHCERLRRWFSPYSRVEYIDHHVRHIGDPRRNRAHDGPILWVGVRSNLPPLVEWLRGNHLPRRLRVLTNPEDSARAPTAAEFGLPSECEVQTWTPETHASALLECVAAIDIKGTDFRSRNKPPAKAIDFLAAGLPLAMNADSSGINRGRNRFLGGSCEERPTEGRLTSLLQFSSFAHVRVPRPVLA
jgi:hypothetical protein